MAYAHVSAVPAELYITVPPPLRTIAGVHLSTFLISDTLDSQAINTIFHAHMTVISGDNVCGLTTICLDELFGCLATSLLGKHAEWFHNQVHGRYVLLRALHYAPQAPQQSAWVMYQQRWANVDYIQTLLTFLGKPQCV